MKNKIQKSRRDFLKTSVAGAAGIMVGGISIQEASAANVWTNGMQINPGIDNLRVVCCNDPAMITGPLGVTYDSEKAAINFTRLSNNMDSMAMTLAQKATAEEAWAAIFQKPATKSWADVKVLIKTIMTRTSVWVKVCNVLNSLGVPYANMHMTDGFCWPTWNNDSSFIPPITFAGNAGPSSTTWPAMHDYTLVPVSVGSQTINVNCPTDVANEVFDIVVNVASNRGHNTTAGGATLCMKTWYGIFNANITPGAFQSPFHLDPMIAPIVAVNKHNVVIGGTPAHQQLCIIDSLWGMSTFSSGWDYQPNKLLMGTFAPAVDFLCITKIRTSEMHTGTIPSQYLNRMLQDFGYTQAQQDALNWVDMGSTPTVSRTTHGEKFRLHMHVSSPAFKPVMVDLDLPLGSDLRVFASIHDQRGRLVRELVQRRTSETMTFAWDGATSSGMRVPAGMYAIKVSNGESSKSGSLMLAPR